MSLSLRMFTGLVVAIAAIGASGAARADFVVNGGFETGNFNGWTVTGNTSDPTSFGVDSSAPHSGNYAAFFGPQSNPAYLMQTITTVPGITYTLDFWLKNEDGNSPNEFSVAFGSKVLADQVDLPTSNYQHYQYTAMATETSTVLSFGFRNDFAFFDIDDVRLVPEPASVTCLAVGSALAGGFGWRRRARRSDS